MSKITEVYLGDNVRWHCSVGLFHGTVTDITIDKNAAGKMIPWFTISYTLSSGRTYTIRMAGTESYLSMMKFEVLDRNTYAA